MFYIYIISMMKTHVSIVCFALVFCGIYVTAQVKQAEKKIILSGIFSVEGLTFQGISHWLDDFGW